MRGFLIFFFLIDAQQDIDQLGIILDIVQLNIGQLDIEQLGTVS